MSKIVMELSRGISFDSEDSVSNSTSGFPVSLNPRKTAEDVFSWSHLTATDVKAVVQRKAICNFHNHNENNGATEFDVTLDIICDSKVADKINEKFAIRNLRNIPVMMDRLERRLRYKIERSVAFCVLNSDEFGNTGNDEDSDNERG